MSSRFLAINVSVGGIRLSISDNICNKGTINLLYNDGVQKKSKGMSAKARSTPCEKRHGVKVS